jgi:hypothetical protein
MKSYEAHEAAEKVSSAPAFQDVGSAVPVFHQVPDYTTYRAEWTILDGDFVIHFFRPEPDDRGFARQYWTGQFPQDLSDTAEQYFRATKPRIFAQYVPELESWYMRARGFASCLDPEGFIGEFFRQLDQRLDPPAS